MDTQTLIDVVALIDARIAVYTNLDSNDPFYKGVLRSLESLRDELQLGIDGAVSAMETSRESGE